MIEVSVRRDGIDIKGHSGYAPAGRDIVCAGISTLVQVMLESFDKLTADQIESEVSPGKVRIRYRNLSERGILLVDSFSVGVKMIASEYPANVRFV